MQTNPTRDVRRITGGARRKPRALTDTERAQWHSRLRADPDAVRRDLPDLTDWLLATGVRIGEALAVSWDEVDLPELPDEHAVEADWNGWDDHDLPIGLVAVNWKIIRVRGESLRRVPGTKTGEDENRMLDRRSVHPAATAALDAAHANPIQYQPLRRKRTVNVRDDLEKSG